MLHVLAGCFHANGTTVYAEVCPTAGEGYAIALAECRNEAVAKGLAATLNKCQSLPELEAAIN